MLTFNNHLRFSTRLLAFAILLLNCTASFAQEPLIKRSSVIEQYKGKPYYLHFVLKGETITAISKAYNVSKEELMQENPSLQDGLKADQVLRIPQRSEPAGLPGSEPDGKTGIKKESFLEIKPSPNDTKTIPTEQQKKTNVSRDNVYVVKKKETLYGISKQFNISVDELQKANPEISGLQEGMEIIIPGKESTKTGSELTGNNKASEASTDPAAFQEIKVQHGQTVYSISKQYGITVEQFLKLNPDAGQGLKTDQFVKVPAQASTLHTPATTVEKALPANEGHAESTTVPLQLVNLETALGSQKDFCGTRPDQGKTFEIALLLPFDLENADSIIAQDETSTKSTDDFRSYDFFQFYNGILLAADSLEKIGFRAHINVYDADKEADSLKIKKAMRKINLSGMDLVIGPVFAKSFDVASRYALKENVSIINPLSKRNKILAGNPAIYMVQPSDEYMASGMASYISRNYQGANVIICRNGMKELASFSTCFVRDLKRYDSLSGLRIKELNYAVESFAGLTKTLSADKHNVVLMFSESRSMVPNFVSMLNTANKNQNITLVGLPGWENLGIETEFLAKLDYRQATPEFVDYNSDAVTQFVKQYRNAYSAEPLEDKHAFLGFDIGWFFFQALMNYGPDFGPCLPNMNIKGLQNNFKFVSDSPLNGFQNTSCRIIQLNDYKWLESR